MGSGLGEASAWKRRQSEPGTRAEGEGGNGGAVVRHGSVEVDTAAGGRADASGEGRVYLSHLKEES